MRRLIQCCSLSANLHLFRHNGLFMTVCVWVWNVNLARAVNFNPRDAAVQLLGQKRDSPLRQD